MCSLIHVNGTPNVCLSKNQGDPDNDSYVHSSHLSATADANAQENSIPKTRVRCGFHFCALLSENVILAVRATGTACPFKYVGSYFQWETAWAAASASKGEPEMTFTLSTLPSAVKVASITTTPSTPVFFAPAGY